MAGGPNRAWGPWRAACAPVALRVQSPVALRSAAREHAWPWPPSLADRNRQMYREPPGAGVVTAEGAARGCEPPGRARKTRPTCPLSRLRSPWSHSSCGRARGGGVNKPRFFFSWSTLLLTDPYVASSFCHNEPDGSEPADMCHSGTRTPTLPWGTRF